MQRRFGTPILLSAPLIIIERIFDVMTLSILGLLFVDVAWLRVILGATALASYSLFFFSAYFAGFADGPLTQISRLRDADVQIKVGVFSLAIWVPTAVILTVAAMNYQI